MSSVAPPMHTKNIRLRNLEQSDVSALFDLCNHPSVSHNWSPEFHSPSPNAFSQKLQRRIEHRWEDYRVMVDNQRGIVFGFAYCYNTSQVSGTAFLSLCARHPSQSSRPNMQACYLYLNHLFYNASIRKLYLEVLAYNQSCLKLCRHLDLPEEGVLREYQYWQGRYWNQHLFALDRPGFARLCSDRRPLLKRLLCQLQTH